MQNLVYGLDFGTSNSAVAVINQDGQSEVLKIGSNQSRTIRSVLFFPYVKEKQRLHFVGDEAINTYISSGMQGRFLQSIKSILPEESFSGTILQGDFLEAEDLAAFILKYIKVKADALVGQDIKKVVLGRPAKFSDDPSSDATAEQRLFIAAQKAGFTDIKFQLEPIAAALHYESSLVGDKENLVFVADLGGGTSDFTIMKLSANRIYNLERQKDVLASAGVYIGGDSFDSDIMWNKLCVHFGRDSMFKSYDKFLPFPAHIIHKICRWQDIGFMKTKDMRLTLQRFVRTSDDSRAIQQLQALINEDLGFSLFRKIEAAKISISSSDEADIIFDHPRIQIVEKISRGEFDEFISEKLQKIKAVADDVLKQAEVSPSDINAVFITGGTSIIPSVRHIFEERFGINKVISSDSFTSVVSGLALSSRLFF